MSTRQLRKLQKQRELERAQDLAAEDDVESEEDIAPVASKPRVSLFAALGGGDDEDEEDEQDEDEAEPEPVKEEPSDVPQPMSSSKSKKKKKKKKKAKAAAATSGSPEPAPLGDEEGEDEIDRAMKELNIKTQQGNTDSAGADADASTRRRINELLKINLYYLKAANEMRNLFGREIIESAAAEEEQEERNRHRRGAPVQRQVDLETFLRSPPGAKKLPEISLRRNVFIQGRDHWPMATAGGLTMREIKKADDGSWTEYAYLHEGQYDDVQQFFFTCVQIGDPMRMVHLLKEVPYHVSTLLQVSSVAKQDQNMALAAELCERALFTFGRMTTSAFRQNIEQGKARLDFRRPENRQFWLAGYHYLKSLIRKGTYRTALEWAKLLYTLDPRDPYAMRHFIHFLAIRAHESRWLVAFMEELEKTSDNRDSVYLGQTLVLAKLQMGDLEGARADLARGMQRVPWLFCAMFQELNLDTPPSIWGISADSNARSFWVKLYVYQTKELWNNPQAIGLLQDVAKHLDKVDVSALPSDDPPPDLGATRLVYLEGQTSLMAVAPRELLDRQPNYEFDPLPPPQEENIFTSEGTQLPWRERTRPIGTATSEIEARMHNMFARQAAAVAPGGAGVNDLDLDEEELARIDLDNEELRRDIEEHARQGDGQGLMNMLMQMLRGRVGEPSGAAEEDDEDDARGLDSYIEEAEGLPGSWPVEDEEESARGERDATGSERRGEDHQP